MKVVNDRLKEYCNDTLKLTSVLNKFTNYGVNFKEFDGYQLLGEYIRCELEKLDNLTRQLEFYLSKMDTLAIFFIAGMEEDVLQRMFGEPVYHNEFGEGFEGVYNPTTQKYSKPLRKESYASYMIELNNYIFHIGYDHRGTRIEVQSDIDPKVLLECLKEISDLYIKNI